MKLERGLNYKDELRDLRKLRFTDRVAYKKLMLEIMQRYGISKRTTYRDMNKRNPGLRKVRSDRGKLRSHMKPKAKKVFSEALETGARKGVAVKMAEKYQGRSISSRLSARTKPVNVKLTNFGGDIKTFLEKITGYDLISPQAGMKLKLKGLPFIVNKDDLSDIILILTNAYNRDNSDKLPLDKNELFRKKIFQLLEYSIKLAESNADLKSLESITRMYNSIQEEHDLGADFEIVYKICSTLKAGISRPEVISLIKQHAS